MAHNGAAYSESGRMRGGLACTHVHRPACMCVQLNLQLSCACTQAHCSRKLTTHMRTGSLPPPSWAAKLQRLGTAALNYSPFSWELNSMHPFYFLSPFVHPLYIFCDFISQIYYQINVLLLLLSLILVFFHPLPLNALNDPISIASNSHFHSEPQF